MIDHAAVAAAAAAAAAAATAAAMGWLSSCARTGAAATAAAATSAAAATAATAASCSKILHFHLDPIDGVLHCLLAYYMLDLLKHSLRPILTRLCSSSLRPLFLEIREHLAKLFVLLCR
jgi:hypothetical protein